MSTTTRSMNAELGGAVTHTRPWSRVLWTAGILLILAVFTALYYKQTFVGITDRHSMDVAHIARNIAQGRGFTTHLIRPLNVALTGSERDQIHELNTAPAFPHAVAAMFMLRSPSDQCAAWVSLICCFLTTGAALALGWVLFGWRVGLLAAAVLQSSATVLAAAKSGTEWTLAAFLFTLLLLAIALHHRSATKARRSVTTLYPAVCGLLLALLYVTNHVLLSLVFPLAVYFAMTGRHRRRQLVVFASTAIVLVAPWAYRNLTLVHGSILGATAWDLMAHTTAFPGDQIYRSTDPANLSVLRILFFPIEHFWAFVTKLSTGLYDVLRGFAAVVGVIVGPAALISMLYRFRMPTPTAVRGFIYGAGIVLAAAFALFSGDQRGVILLAPAMSVFGSAYLLLLLDAKKLHPVYARAVIGFVVLVTCWPALSNALWRLDHAADSKALASTIILNDSFSGTMYTDVPWSVAWRTSGMAVWLPFKDEDVYKLSSRGLAMEYALLTPECNSYPQDDTWYLLHRFQFWRTYLKDPTSSASRILISKVAARPELSTEQVERELRERKRQFRLVETVDGCTAEHFGGLAPDDYVIVTFPPRK